jgi:hypothetical protein
LQLTFLGAAQCIRSFHARIILRLVAAEQLAMIEAAKPAC